MGSSGLLFLLLLSSALLFCSTSQPQSSKHPASNQPKDQHYRLQKRGPKTEAVLTAADYIIKIGSAASPFIEMIPVAGPIITEIIDLAGAVLEATKPDPTQTLLNELKNIESQLVKYNKEQIWNTWASQYAKFERNINVGWTEFGNLMKVLTDKNVKQQQKTNHINDFRKKFQTIALSTSQLHQALTNKNTYFSPEFEKLISEKTNCHESEIKALAVSVNSIIYKGNTVNYYYNGLVKVDGINALTEIAFDCAKAMFEIHKKCINDPLPYVKQDITKLIENISGKSESSERKQLTKTIRLALENAYDRYDWIVVVFITEKSKHDVLDILNEHILSGFTEASRGEVTAAVARQVKGKHTKADEVRKAIDKCFEKQLPDCHEVKSELDKCGKSYGIDLSKAYSAIHAYIDESDDSYKALNAKDAPEEYIGTDASSTIPHIYKGNCKKYKLFSTGRFRVLIKSDEELAEEPPCKKLQCNKVNGNCELLDNNQIPVCVCKEGFYGENCEESVENYKKRLRKSKKQMKQ